MERKINFVRKTKETEIEISMNLDGIGKNKISTGIGLFNHLLEQIAIHGSFDLIIKVKGDLNVGAHHTIEDTGIALGKAFKKALHEKRAIMRTASTYFPLDEALCRVIIDISGRPFLKKKIEWKNTNLADSRDYPIPTSLLDHFLYSFIVNAKITAYINVISGEDNHHIAESIFKALGKTLDKATRIDNKKKNQIPSSKGLIE